ncbi:MAG: yefM [Gammaproteobacteria bacterium]|jgi:antitoxin YefM|nr:yefM [Gammaproteobacteria bacterium]
MHTITTTELRQNLADALDKVNEDHIPIIITRQNGKEGVLMSLEDFRSYEETLFLLSNPNAKRLQQSLNNAKKGKYKPRDLIE